MSPTVLRQIIDVIPEPASPRVAGGVERAEDAAVYYLSPERALLNTVDVIAPLVDDPRVFGAIAAANAVSDIYAMGGTPLCSVSVLVAPRKLPASVLRDILAGAALAAEQMQAPICGGHSVYGDELLFGLAVTGEAHPQRLWRNRGLAPGTELILTKPLGTGIVASASRRGTPLLPEAWREVQQGMQQSNGLAHTALASQPIVAATDVTGFGLAGHLAEMAQASQVRVDVYTGALPVYAAARERAWQSGELRGSMARNREYTESLLQLRGQWPQIAFDPQTSGGLLLGVAPQAKAVVLAMVRQAGYNAAVHIGTVTAAGKACLQAVHGCEQECLG